MSACYSTQRALYNTPGDALNSAPTTQFINYIVERMKLYTLPPSADRTDLLLPGELERGSLAGVGLDISNT